MINGLALEAGHAGPHNLVDKEKVAGDDGAGVDHLSLDPIGVVDAQGGGQARLARVTVHPDLQTTSQMTCQNI